MLPLSVLAVNSANFYRVTHSYTSRPFLCVLGPLHVPQFHIPVWSVLGADDIAQILPPIPWGKRTAINKASVFNQLEDECNRKQVLCCTVLASYPGSSPEWKGTWVYPSLPEICYQGNTCNYVTDLGPHPGVPAKIVARPQLKLANTCTWKQHLGGRGKAEIRMKYLSSKLLSRPFNHNNMEEGISSYHGAFAPLELVKCGDMQD